MKKLFIILLLPLSVYSQTEKSTVDSMRVIFFELLNQHRIDNGLDTLIISDTHNEEAQSRAKYMYDTGDYSHNKAESPENIASARDISMQLDFKIGVFRIFNSWKKSPGHNRNYLNPRYTHVGFGSYKGYSVVVF